MTHEEFRKQLKDVPNLELAEKAQLALSKLCSTGGKSFTMTVPTRLDDTDMLFREIISRFELMSLPSLESEERWISVKDELPNIPQFVIAYKNNGLILGLYFSADKEFRYGQDCDQTSQVTHWMPLPNAPKKAEINNVLPKNELPCGKGQNIA